MAEKKKTLFGVPIVVDETLDNDEWYIAPLCPHDQLIPNDLRCVQCGTVIVPAIAGEFGDFYTLDADGRVSARYVQAPL